MDFGKLMSKYIFTSRIHLIVKDSAINEIPSHQDYYNNLIWMTSVYVQLDGISDAPTFWVLIPNLHWGNFWTRDLEIKVSLYRILVQGGCICPTPHMDFKIQTVHLFILDCCGLKFRFIQASHAPHCKKKLARKFIHGRASTLVWATWWPNHLFSMLLR